MLKDLLTIGEVADLVDAAPRTVQKWCDKFGLGHRLPGTSHRRVRKSALREFLTKHGWPIPAELQGAGTWVGFEVPLELQPAHDSWILPTSLVSLGHTLANGHYEAVVVSASIGQTEVKAISLFHTGPIVSIGFGTHDWATIQYPCAPSELRKCVS